jgi:monoterpene epsilon-lactone hydrolase
VTSELLGQIVSGMPFDFAHPDDDFATTREKMAPLHGHPGAADTAVRTVEIDGIPAAWLSRPSSDPERGAVLFCHGGAFVSCDLEAYLFYAEFIADWVGVPVLTVDYRLAPEHPFPAALDDCARAYRGLLAEGQDPARLLCVGDSCGGGLALATVTRAREAGLAVPAGVISLSGWLDLDPVGYPSPAPVVRDPFVTDGFLRARARDYLGVDGDPHHPGASAGRATVQGLPPLLLQVGETDLCRGDAERLARRARADGVDARLDVVPGGVHGVQGLVNLGVPEAVAAWESVRLFADELLGAPVRVPRVG